MSTEECAIDGPDISVVLNIHREVEDLRKALLSINIAVAEAIRSGLEVELVAVFDRSNESTAEVFGSADLSLYCTIKKVEVDHGNLAEARNSGIDRALGEYVMLADADDLISQHSIIKLRSRLERCSENTIAFCEFLVGFGSEFFVTHYSDLREISVLGLLERNLFTSRAMARREIFCKHRFEATHPASPHFFEDWHFNCECVASGYDLVVAKDTAIYYRQHGNSIMASARQVANPQIAPTKLFEPATYTKIARQHYQEWQNHNQVNEDLAEATARFQLLRQDLEKVHAIETACDPRKILRCPITSYQGSADLGLGASFFEIAEIVGNSIYDHVFILPFSALGGADRFVHEVAASLYKLDPTSSVLVILGEHQSSQTTEDLFPPSATVINLGRDWEYLSLEQRTRLAGFLVRGAAPNSFVHVRESPFGEMFLEWHRNILEDCKIVLYPFAPSFSRPNRTERYTSKENVEKAYLLISDNQVTISEGVSRFNSTKKKWKCLRAPHERRATDNKRLASIVKREKKRILWASRLAEEKRPSLLEPIGMQLRAKMGFELDVFGAIGDDAHKRYASSENYNYCGPFSEFSQLDVSAYACLIYTSWFDGMPNIILEAASQGLPVVAPDVGAICDFIEDGVTGYLLPSLNDDQEMADQYVEAVRKISLDPSGAAIVAEFAGRRLVEMFSRKEHEQKVFELFFAGEGNAAILSDPANSSHNNFSEPLKAIFSEKSQTEDLSSLIESVNFLTLQNKKLQRALRCVNERASSKTHPARHGSVYYRAGTIQFSDGFLPEGVARDLSRAWRTKWSRELIRIISKIGKRKLE